MLGKDILKIAAEHIGEDYILGARAKLSNPNHSGPWDCAEYTSWCAYQAYKIVFGTYGTDPKKADPYSGKWYEDGDDNGTLVSVGEALVTPGAFVVRRPNDFNTKFGHVAICIGDGRLYEARSASAGVTLSDDAYERNWTSGVQLPGVLYTPGQVKPYAVPHDILRVKHPFVRGEHVRTVQCALYQKGFSPGEIDGVYGGDTEAALTNYQLAFGLTVDGEVGPETAKLLAVGWPIDTSLATELCSRNAINEDEHDDQDLEDDDDLRGDPDDISIQPDTASITIEASGRDYWAEHESQRFFVGTKVPYGSYWGLYQRGSDLNKLGGGGEI